MALNDVCFSLSIALENSISLDDAEEVPERKDVLEGGSSLDMMQ